MIIGVDFGKKIGLAYSVDSLAVPYCVVDSVKNAAQKIIQKRAKFLVIGWPLLLDGTPGEQCATTQKMLNELLKIIGQTTSPMEYFLQDERFSSKFLRNIQNEHAHSAAWILQIYLDVKSRENAKINSHENF